jgi:transposase
MSYRRGAEDRWRRLVKAQLASGLDIKTFSEREKVCLSSLYGWRKRLGLAPDNGTRPVPVSLQSGQRDQPKGFLQLTPSSPGSLVTARQVAISIETPNGYRIEAQEGALLFLKGVLELLKTI